MKRKLLFTMALVLGLMFSNSNTNACTNFLVTKGATTDGSTMVTYAADSHTLYGELYFRAAKDYAEGTLVDVYEWDTGKWLGKIKQVKHTYSVVGNMNEHQLAIGETTFTGREELKDSTGLVDYGSLIYLALQRSKTAREAIKVMAELVAENGYYSTGESFSIADANEVWIMEMIGKGPGNKGALWVAMQIPDGYISGHANQARITTFPFQKVNNFNDPKQVVFHSPDVITFAKEKGYYKGEDKDFSFSDTYAPLDYSALRFCEARVWSGFRRANASMDKYFSYVNGESKERMPLWIKPDKKLSVKDVMELMRDHYQGTYFDMTKDAGAGPYKCPYRWRPMTWKLDTTQYCHERAISTQQTGFSFVSQSRSWLPAPIGGVLWFGMDDTYSTVYVPMYCGITRTPHSFAVGTGSFKEFSWESAFWVFNAVSNYAYSRYSDMIVDIRKVQSELESKFIAFVPAMDKAAMEIYNTNPAAARELLTDFSCSQGDNTTKRWMKLFEELIFKYIDGNPKDEKGNVTHPRYPDEWYKVILRDDPNHFKMKTLK